MGWLLLEWIVGGLLHLFPLYPAVSETLSATCPQDDPLFSPRPLCHGQKTSKLQAKIKPFLSRKLILVGVHCSDEKPAGTVVVVCVSSRRTIAFDKGSCIPPKHILHWDTWHDLELWKLLASPVVSLWTSGSSQLLALPPYCSVLASLCKARVLMMFPASC